MKEKCELRPRGDKTFEYEFCTPIRKTSNQNITSKKHSALIERFWKFYVL